MSAMLFRPEYHPILQEVEQLDLTWLDTNMTQSLGSNGKAIGLTAGIVGHKVY